MHIENLPDLDIEVVVNSAYLAILRAANEVLTSCRKNLDIQYLKSRNPTLSEILEEMKSICGLMKSLADSHYISFKADEYVGHVSDIVSAVESDDIDQLKNYVDVLNKRSFL